MITAARQKGDRETVLNMTRAQVGYSALIGAFLGGVLFILLPSPSDAECTAPGYSEALRRWELERELAVKYGAEGPSIWQKPMCP